jgi:hypothetical protein
MDPAGQWQEVGTWWKLLAGGGERMASFVTDGLSVGSQSESVGGSPEAANAWGLERAGIRLLDGLLDG